MTQHLTACTTPREPAVHIGVSVNALARFAQHKLDKPWIDDVAKVTIESHKCSRSEIGRWAQANRVWSSRGTDVAHNTLQCARPPRAAIRGESRSSLVGPMGTGA